jgi:hypothetical protein
MVDVGRAVTPAKRKLDDRELKLEELERRETRPPPGEVNGGHTMAQRTPRASMSPLMHRKKRIRHQTPPTWAQTHAGSRSQTLNHANAEMRKRGPPSINGKQSSVGRQDRASRHASPETTRSVPAAAPPPVESKPESNLGPWEPCITGVRPYEELSRQVADFLFINVVNNNLGGEIANPDIQFEIEAKLGTLIDKDTNERVYRYVTSECLLHDTGRIAFRSSMTEVGTFLRTVPSTVKFISRQC